MNTPIFNRLCRTYGNPLKPERGSIHIDSGAITTDKISANVVTGDTVVETLLNGDVIRYLVAERPISGVMRFTPLRLVYPDGLPLE